MPDPIFASIDDVKAMMRGGANNLEADIRMYLPAVTLTIQGYTRRNWIKGVYTEWFRTPGASDLRAPVYMLKERNIDFSTPPVVTYDVNGIHPSDYIPLVSGTDYTITEAGTALYESPRLVLNACTDYSERGIKVVYTAGYAMHDTTGVVAVPYNVKMACAIQVAHIIRRNLTAAIGKDSKTDNNKDTVKYGKDANALLVAEAMALLQGGERRIMVGRG